MSKIGDEHIILARINAEMARKNTLLETATIDGEMHQFERRERQPDFSMILPVNFQEMSYERLILKYPSVYRPKDVISNADGNVTFAFECMFVGAEKLEVRLTEYKATIKKMHPSYVFFSEDIYVLENDMRIACYDFRGVAIDKDSYCFHFFTDLPNGELFGCFSCPIDSQSSWEPLFRQMIKTIEPLSEEESNGRE